MQFKIFTIPILGGEAQTEALNLFLRAKKVLQVERQLVSAAPGVFWSFCVSYLDDREAAEFQRPKVDYQQTLDKASYARFSQMREIRKRLAQEEAVPAYAIFTDEELATLAKFENLSAAAMKSAKGIGEKKVEKYGAHFLNPPGDEKSEQPD